MFWSAGYFSKIYPNVSSWMNTLLAVIKFAASCFLLKAGSLAGALAGLKTCGLARYFLYPVIANSDS